MTDQLRTDSVKYPSHDWGALAQNPTVEIGATGEAWVSAVRSAWLRSGGTEESFERAFPAYAAQHDGPSCRR